MAEGDGSNGHAKPEVKMPVVDAKQAGELTHEQICKSCGVGIVFQIPSFEVVNANSVSAIIFSHPYTQDCPSCGQPYQVVVGKPGAISFGFVPLARTSNIIKPTQGNVPPGLKT